MILGCILTSRLENGTMNKEEETYGVLSNNCK